jgi:flagellar hook-length control protein FliK
MSEVLLPEKAEFIAAHFQPAMDAKLMQASNMNQVTGWQSLPVASVGVFVPSLAGDGHFGSRDGGQSSQQQQEQQTATRQLVESLANMSSETTFEEEDTGFGSLLGNSVVSTGSLASTKVDLFSPMSFRQPQWTHEMSQRVAAMNHAKVSEISVKLNPESLGSISVQLKMQEDNKAHLVFTAQHGLTKDMLENALPRLKEMLSGQGIELASAFVGTGDTQNQQFGQSGFGNSSQGYYQGTSEMLDDADTSVVDNAHSGSRQTNSQIDHYV